jgi:hypothetical protein
MSKEPMVTPTDAGSTTFIKSEKIVSGEIAAPCRMMKLVPIITRVDGMGAMISSIILPRKTPKGP